MKILITGGTTFVSRFAAEYMEYIDNNLVKK